MKKSSSPHLELAHVLWKDHLQEGDWAIDATCGNGWDTLALAEMVGPLGRVIGFDVQDQAIEETKEKTCHFPQVELRRQSHEDFGAMGGPISLIVYNLGYLPGSDKKVTTMAPTTLQSVKNSFNLIRKGGMISITCYPGHEEGSIEEKALLELVSALPSHVWDVCHYRWVNRPKSPSLIKIISRIVKIS